MNCGSPIGIRLRTTGGGSMKRVLKRIPAVLIGLALLTGSLHAQSTFVYTDNNIAVPASSNTVSAFSVLPNGALAPVSGSPFPSGGTGDGSGGLSASHRITVTRNFLYAANDRSNDISAFKIDTTTGVLTTVAGSPFVTGGSGNGGISLAVTPNGRFLYAGSNASSNISIFSIAPSTGALTLIGSPVPTGPAGVAGTPAGIKVSPNGRFLAVALPFDPAFFSGGAVAMFAIDGSTGALTPVTGSPFATRAGGDFATDVDINCKSNLLFNAEGTLGTTTVSVFAIAPNGALNPITGSPFIFPNGLNSNVGVLSPDNQHLFVSNQGSNQITSLDLAPGPSPPAGTLSEETGSPVGDPGGTTPDGMATNREGTLLYVANENNVVTGFQIDSDGGLTPLTPVNSFPTGATGSLQSLTVFPPASCLTGTDAPITAKGTTFGATEGVTFTGTVATFTDPDPASTAAEYSATIDWGDTTPTTPGTISGPPGGPFTVNGTQTYTGPTAIFTDQSSTGTLSDFSATISWGDGSSSAGTISGGPGNAPYTVSGNHTYASTGTFSITTSIKDVGGSTTTSACSVTIFAFATGRGAAFVIGDLEAGLGNHVTWWSSQWANINLMSGGTPPNSMKGFAGFEDNFLGLPPPNCGGSWSTDTGNSTPPPPSVPKLMGVIVSSMVTQSGSIISGNIKQVVIVRNDPGYAPSPGHPGTGTEIAIVCAIP